MIHLFVFLPVITVVSSFTSPARFHLKNHAIHQRQHAANTMLSAFSTTGVTAITDLFNNLFEKKQDPTKLNPVDLYFDAWNRQNIDAALAQFAETCEYEDATFSAPFVGKAELRRHFLLLADATEDSVDFLIDDMAVSSSGDKVGVKYHSEMNGIRLPNSRRCAFFNVNVDSEQIISVFDVIEPTSKTGEANLALLSTASKVIGLTQKNRKTDDVEVVSTETSERTEWLGSLLKGTQTSSAEPLPTAPEKYFEAWNRRDMNAAIALFTEGCQYEDTVFPNPFVGKEALKNHLLLCAAAFPTTFQFVVDDVADGNDKVAVKWHVANNGEALPYTRGCSFYKVDRSSGLICEGFDEVEPAGLKRGGLSLLISSLTTKVKAEPIRLVPLVAWVMYMYIVFFSDGILPGANALQLEQRTWEEVRDLSLNFLFVSPVLGLQFSPVVHPILEGVFNLLLAWAALFAGFFSDERNDKPNLLPVLPVVAGMQFLTSAFLLPYLATRTTEKASIGNPIYKEDLGMPARLVESPILGPLLGSVGAGSIMWGILARQGDFGDWSHRVASFWELMSIDRVGSSFLVDLAIFALFQGWLVDDDMKRRGIRVDDGEGRNLRNVAKFVPFFGMAAYMTMRPRFPSRDDDIKPI